jgi:sec-independent protein translocase protein TatA
LTAPPETAQDSFFRNRFFASSDFKAHETIFQHPFAEALMFGIGVQELLIILVIVLIVFGAKNLPILGSNMGRAISNFKRGLTEPEVIDIKPEQKSKSAQS